MEISTEKKENCLFNALVVYCKKAEARKACVSPPLCAKNKQSDRLFRADTKGRVSRMDKKFWSALAASIDPYVPGEQPKIADLVKLNTNENPYPPSPKVIAAVQEAADGALRLYPDPESVALREAIAKREGVSPAQVFIGNGSDEVLALSFLAFFDPELPLRFPDITYSFYEVYASLYRLTVEKVPLDADFSLPVEKLLHSPGGVIFPNPNAPTGRAVGLDAIRLICKENDRAVIVDEAYVEFGAQSAVPLLSECPNLVVVRTFSKSHALAGLRVGYAIASESMITALNSIKNSFNSYPIDRVAQAAAKAAVEDEPYLQNVLKKIVATREESKVRLEKMGFFVLPSCTNFLFASHPRANAAMLQKELRVRGVLVRYFKSPRIDNYLRITVGTDAEMDRLCYALEDILKEAGL